ncbi:cell division protein FtsL [Ahrensia kielensis]|uniref:cell division protein FtsL n=1 Tax=Ahrensia kielensis TaxID=76980 RepID=UPI000363174A|nr:hypothetical protein [Ahrensia kielensis]
MMRWINLLFLGLVIAAATWTYQVKHEAEVKLTEIRELQNKIALERETIELLKADWAFLSHPARLEKLAKRYEQELGLQVTEADQIISADELPDVPVFAPGDDIGDLIAGEAIDDLQTGSIEEGQSN